MTFYHQLLHTIDGWNKDPIEDEWLFEKFREQFVKPLTTVEAFETINETVDLLLCQTDESTAIEVMQTLIALARQSNTTEAPSNLLARRLAIASQFSNYGDYANAKLVELLKIYRL